MNNQLKNLKVNLQHLMESRDLTLSSVAKKARVNKSTFHSYLNGVTPRSLATIVSLATFFQVEPADLLFKNLKDLPKNQPNLKQQRFEITIRTIDEDSDPDQTFEQRRDADL